MGVYSLDRSSPKKGGPHRGGGGLAELKRRLTSRRYLCLWILVALVPCYLIRQMFNSQSSTATSYARASTDGGQLPALSRKALPTEVLEKSVLKPSDFGEMEGDKVAEKATAVSEKPAEATKKAKEKSVLDFIFKHNTIKPAKYDKNSGKKSKASVRGNLLKLRLKENFVDDGDFGVAEDNDKAEEQLWTAPPSPEVPKKTSEEEESP